jgi:hypothetical protein
MNTLEDFKKYNMKGLRFELVITADTENDLADALQRAIEDLGQGNKQRTSGTDEWFYSYRIDGKAIDEDDTDTWLAKHRERVDAFYAKGLDFKPDPECSMCDADNDYICFVHELEQLRESEKEEV